MLLDMTMWIQGIILFLKNNMETITFKEAQNKKNCQWIDIRSPREYAKGHLTNAINIPLFNNEQFKELGTIYNLYLLHSYAIHNN